jgi:hypothetical protein
LDQAPTAIVAINAIGADERTGGARLETALEIVQCIKVVILEHGRLLIEL